MPARSDRVFNDPELTKQRAAGLLQDDDKGASEIDDIQPIVREHVQRNAPRPILGTKTGFSSASAGSGNGGIVALLALVATVFAIIAGIVLDSFVLGLSAAFGLYLLLLITFIALKD